MKKFLRKISKKITQKISFLLDDFLSSKSLIILSYHSVSDNDSPISISPDRFDEQMKLLSGGRFKVLSLEEALGFINNKFSNNSNLTKVLITFDDGFEDVFYKVLPILKTYGFPAVCFINPKFLGQKVSHSTREVDSQRKLLNLEQLLELADNKISIANHSFSHHYFDDSDLNRAKEEYLMAKEWIDKNIPNNSFGDIFAYPKSRITNESFLYLTKLGLKKAFAGEGPFFNFYKKNKPVPRVTVFNNWRKEDFSINLSPSYSLIKSKQDILFKVFKYGLVAIFNLFFNIGSTAFLIEILLWQPNISYLLSSALDYVFKYITNMTFVFNKRSGLKYAPAFVAYLVIFWIFNNIFFHFFQTILGFNYIFVIVLNMAVFWSLRFWALHKFVFKD